MASVKELQEFYRSIYGKDFPSSTLSKWSSSGRIIRKELPQEERLGASKYDYDMESFKNIILNEEYAKKIKASRENPKDYIGKTIGQLKVVGIVPPNERKGNYKGTLMYCQCLRCKRPDLIQVRFAYLTPNGNYFQETCGCGRKERAFLASAREGIRKEFLDKYSENFEYFLFLHKLLCSSATEGYYASCSIEEYENAITYLDNNEQFHKVYNFWKTKEKENTFYDWAKPSLDHIIPKSKGGSNEISNLQVLTVFENLAKRDMTWEEWTNFKNKTNTHSDYYIENILKL